MRTTGGRASVNRENTLDDTLLVARLQAGNPDAFEELVRAYGGQLLAVTRRFLRNEEDAQDAVQDAFLSAFRALDRFEGKAKLSTWLHRIAVNAALMKIRTRQRKPEDSIEHLLPRFLEDGHQADPSPAWKDSTDSLLQRHEIRVQVRTCIDRLPDTYRLVVLLRDIDEYDTQETAAMLGISPNAVKIRLHRARQALRSLLDPHLREAAL